MPGVTEPVKVVVFTNKGKEKNEKAPDYVIYRSEEVAQKNNVEAVAKEAAQEVKSTAQAAADEVIPEDLFNQCNKILWKRNSAVKSFGLQYLLRSLHF